MKKLLAIFLLLSLLCTQAFAIGDDIVVTGEYYCEYYDEAGNLLIYATAVIENWAETPQSPVHTGFLVLAKDGSVMIETPPTLYPPVIDAMGRAYVAAVFCLDKAQQEQYDHVQLSFFPGSGMAGEPVQYLHADSAEGIVTNETEKTMDNVTVLQLYYNENEEIIGTQLDTLTLHAGESAQPERTFQFAPYTACEVIAYRNIK